MFVLGDSIGVEGASLTPAPAHGRKKAPDSQLGRPAQTEKRLFRAVTQCLALKAFFKASAAYCSASFAFGTTAPMPKNSWVTLRG
jgi:hypothetical protein